MFIVYQQNKNRTLATGMFPCLSPAMTPAQQNEALALLGGWVKKEIAWGSSSGLEMSAMFWVSDTGSVTCEPPDFRAAAKLLGKVEVVLTYEQKRAVDQFVMDNDGSQEAYSPYRMEGILRVLGIWK